ncbi:5'-3' exoribonuclease 3 isoform X2 [Spinacia oleracea]|uniref:5'-3' exoribonuclease 3 isoform X2 n=1 Tax=Spinacia oleracea TaxID=3562 RepID=A0ABM3QSB7_SPIOL|nr:5'-3' exoribonuclease 3-like isoform X2 [Spinacia oleracea]
MGVPAFYRWLVDKYPKIVVNAIEQKDDNYVSLPNPNGLEFDNLYLDMNGIIHPCFHPNHLISTPTTFDQVFENIYAYIDRLVSIVKPRKLLYLAIDGVAPRAKMNQQRSRRFKSAKDNQTAEEEERRLRDDFKRKGKKLLTKQESQVSDSNVITPGTEFMHELSRALNSYIHRKLNNDPAWAQLEVILSDATVPGEGEHKVMSFIRTKRTLPDYDPNTSHCIYGLDADLIMLALATHEFYFSILREDVLAVQEHPVSETTLVTSIQKAEQHSLDKSSLDKPKPFFEIADKNNLIQPHHYQFLHVWILREYLELDMQIVDPPEKLVFDVDRIVDDFIFLCFFVGNDFLPHMPTLEMHENPIDLLMYVYKEEFKSFGGYLVDMERINDKHASYIKLKRVEKFILSVGSYEEKIFKKRTDIRDKRQRRILSQLESEKNEEYEECEVSGMDLKEHETGRNNPGSDIQEMLENTKELNEKLKDCLRKKSDIFRDGNLGIDKVKLGSAGWKQRYYKEKFLVEDPKEVEIMRKQIVHKYTEGLCWVLLYYFSGIPSWNWYYPYYYGPFASDLKGLAGVKVEFQKGFPFKPFDQLMAVLPPRSAHALPKVYQQLMTESSSDIIEFYPNDFEVDLDGKRFLWQGICKLPFIEQEKLVAVTKQVEQKVKDSEAARNVETTDKLLIRASNSSKRDCGGYYSQQQVAEIHDGIMCFNFELPVASHIPRLLEGIQPTEKKIFDKDIKATVPWHEYSGRPPITRHYERYRNAAVDVGTRIKTAGLGRGFEPAGRGKGISWNESEYIQSTSTYCHRNMNRGNTQNSFWRSRSGVVPHENASWRPVSHTGLSYSRKESEGSSVHFRPCNGNAPQFTGRGRSRGRGRSGPYNQYSTEGRDYKDHNRW